MGQNGEKNVQKRGRPRANVDLKLFKTLCEQGLTDEAVAESLGTSRWTVIRLRREHGIAPNRKKGERGPGKPREDNAYHLEVRRVLRRPEIAHVICDAARKFRKEGGDPVKSFVATGMFPAPVPVFPPGPYTTRADKTNLTVVKRILSAEKQVEQAAAVGVPGPSIFELARVFKTASREVVERLALQAVKEAFFVGVHQTVAAVRKMAEQAKIKLEGLFSKTIECWRRTEEEALAWAPVQKEKKLTLSRPVKERRSRIRTGKRGKGDGTLNIELRLAFASAKGY